MKKEYIVVHFKTKSLVARSLAGEPGVYSVVAEAAGPGTAAEIVRALEKKDG